MRPKAYTQYGERLLDVIRTECVVHPAFNPIRLQERGLTPPPGIKYIAIWDTGASGCVVSERVVNELELPILGYVPVSHAGGSSICPWFKINIMLPNRMGFCEVKATLGNMAGADILIGMSIISQGDFAITNQGGKTTFSFRMPSSGTIDYKQEEVEFDRYYKIHQQWMKSGNDKCPCGSGKKYKNCHGKQ